MVGNMIKLQIETMLRERGKTLYWLASPAGADVEYATLWRVAKGKSKGISFELLDHICDALECEPGDLLKKVSIGTVRASKKAKKGGAKA